MGIFENLRDTLRLARRSHGHGIQVCPNCGSTEIHPRFVGGGWLFPPSYTCDDCGYLGQVVLELHEDKEAKD